MESIYQEFSSMVYGTIIMPVSMFVLYFTRFLTRVLLLKVLHYKCA